MLLLATAVFIGNQACGPCHAAILENYSRTPMARSSGRVESLPDATFTAAGQKYSISGKRLSFQDGSVPMDYFIGSNAAGQSFLFQREGYLFELPVTWYAQKKMWDASPGYDREAEVRLNRAIEPSCLLCHSSQSRPVLGSQNRYGDPPFLQNGVGCERCHGPGSEHARNPGKAKLLNPAALEPVLRDSVCSQCHLTGEARIEQPGRRIAEFRPGERLSDFASYFVRKRDRGDLKVTSHVEKLSVSACKRATGDKLWCGTCHDPHTNSDKTQTACLSCHPAAHHREQACAGCHMPKSNVVDGGHGVLTDHSIPRKMNRTVSAPGGELIAFLGTADDRSLGLAYAELGDPRARDYLWRATPADAEVRLRLAVMEPDPRRAAALYEAVLSANPSQTVALVNLGTLYARAGRLESAGRLWERALATNPAIEQAVLNLAQIRPADEARLLLRRYLEFNPGSTAAKSRLLQLR